MLRTGSFKVLSLAVLVSALLGSQACSSRGSGQGEVKPSAAGGAPNTSASAAGVASAASPRPPSRRVTDPLWLAAADEDPLEGARLAEVEGAAGLMEGIDDGGAIEQTALRALPYADDADTALGRLGAMARGAQPAAVEPVLEAILGIAGKPPRSREVLDPEGIRACGEAMLEVARRSDLPKAVRALAVSAARALAEKGFVDAGRIPSDLDPPPQPTSQ